ncbi:trimeric intracellular cation channel family protein [Rothia mucilaginosa]|jgi:predicted membrane protein|uniref:TRIC cation channel family protein n=1 Tax=Rothia mucilaginosa TaxID=43675 RepID=A0A930LGQ1_9MICC|nr:TRIC cation channel family protein [Rothia mucilaginosa]MBF1664564.1 TRIC cation channel family protein [Rothia mucilaginosa]
MHELFDPNQVFRIVDIAAVVANGLLGGAVARAFRFDIVGFLLLAVACGMGGGMIRDILLNSGLPVALTDGGYWVGAIGSSILAYSLDLSARWATRTMLIIDFVGMGAWAATGTIKSLNLGLHWLPAIALGVTTAVGGGVIRDIMVNRIPAIFGGNSLYATVAFVGATETAIVSGFFHRPNLAMGLSILMCLVLGVLSHAKNWQLPTTPGGLQVHRPRLLTFFNREENSVQDEGWSPGDPLTDQLQVVSPEQLEEYRRSKRPSE